MDDNKTNSGVGTGFMADMLKDLQKQYGIDKKPKGKGKRGNASKKPSEPKGKPEGFTAMPAGQDAKGTTKPSGVCTTPAGMWTWP